MKAASDFSKLLPEVIEWMTTEMRPEGEVVSNYISGDMPTYKRNKNLQALAEIKPGQRFVLSNARCLSEGIDVPTLDGVAFIDPKNSEIDIIQAVGRAIRLSKEKSISIICGHFEGVDERVLSTRNIEEVSIGDYVLSGGETAALVVLDSVLRLLPGVLGNDKSSIDETFENSLLEYPQYTKPQIWEKKSVPEVLLSGDHSKIKDWRLSQSEAITRDRRPDLWQKYKKD